MCVLKDKDEGRKYRNLLRMEGDLKPFPPYWYFRGSAAQVFGKREDVLHCYDMYTNTQKGFFRQDKTYSSAIMLKVVETDYSETRDRLFADLGKIVELDKKDWRKRLFAAYKLIQYGHLDKAKEEVQANIDSDAAISVSRKALADIYCLENNKDRLAALIDKTIQDQRATSQEVIYLMGKLPAANMIAKIRDQILGIKPEVDTNIVGKDDLIFRVPHRWVLDDPKNLDMKLTADGKDFEAKNVKMDKDGKEFVLSSRMFFLPKSLSKPVAAFL